MNITKSKKILILALSLTLSLTSCARSSDNSNQNQGQTTENSQGANDNISQIQDLKKVGFITNFLGLNDGFANEKVYTSLKDLAKNQEVDLETSETTMPENYVRNIGRLVDRDANFIWALSYEFSDSIREVAVSNPDSNFVIIDSVYEQTDMPQNLTSINFKMYEGSYLAGYMAGLASKTNKVAFIGGAKGGLVSQNEYAYRAGILDASRELKKETIVSVAYLEDFEDKQLAKEQALSLYDQGVDIIYPIAGVADLGVVDAALDKNLYMISYDELKTNIAPENIIINIYKNYNPVVTSIFNKYLAKEDIGGKNYDFGLKEGAVEISEFKAMEEGFIQKSVYDKVKAKQNLIIDGQIQVPFNEETLERFKTTN